MEPNMILLTNPDVPELMQRWGHIAKAVQPLNKWDDNLEIMWWCEYATNCTKLLELGSYNGASTKAMLMANPTLRIHVIDLWEDAGTQETFKAAMGHEISTGQVTFEHTDTVSGLTALHQEGKREEFDGLLIDAGHLYEHVSADLKLGLPLVKQGTLVCGHDYRANLPEDGVTKAVRERFTKLWNPVCSIWAAYNHS
jgi:predicted O-methyltransferase YrrM